MGSEHQRQTNLASQKMVQLMSNINHLKIPSEEVIDKVENSLKQMKTSEHNCKEIREVVGILGWKKRTLRSAKSILNLRCKKKQLEKTTR